MFALNNRLVEDIKITPKVDALRAKTVHETSDLIGKTQQTLKEVLDGTTVKNFSKAYTKPPETGKKIDVKL